MLISMIRGIMQGTVSFTTVIMFIVSWLIIVFLVLPIHEFAHGFTAVKLGDNTPRYQGRLTLNPLAHIDYIGALAILIFGFGWAKPVQVDMRNFRRPKTDMAITALAGPLSNILAALVAMCVGKALMLIGGGSVVLIYVNVILEFLIDINIALAVFNLIPIPPLDGSRLLNAFLPDRIYYNIMRYEQYIIWAVIILLLTDVLDPPLAFLRNLVYYGLDSLTALIFGY